MNESRLAKSNGIVRDFSPDRFLEVLLDIRDLLAESSATKAKKGT